jgi:Protein of unknown function (DUF2934)
MPKSRSVSSEAPKRAAKPKTPPTQEEIAIRAYHLYLERAGAPGDPMEDWLRAEQELLQAATKNGRKPKIVPIAA